MYMIFFTNMIHNIRVMVRSVEASKKSPTLIRTAHSNVT